MNLEITAKLFSIIPCLSLIPTTMVRVVPRGTIPLTTLAQGPFPCWISIHESTLSPEWNKNSYAYHLYKTHFPFLIESLTH